MGPYYFISFYFSLQKYNYFILITNIVELDNNKIEEGEEIGEKSNIDPQEHTKILNELNICIPRNI